VPGHEPDPSIPLLRRRLTPVKVRLQQDQVWQIEAGYLRIVRLECLAVGYKFFKDLSTRDGTHREATKKHFCRLIKAGRLLTTDEALNAQGR